MAEDQAGMPMGFEMPPVIRRNLAVFWTLVCREFPDLPGNSELLVDFLRQRPDIACLPNTAANRAAMVTAYRQALRLEEGHA